MMGNDSAPPDPRIEGGVPGPLVAREAVLGPVPCMREVPVLKALLEPYCKHLASPSCAHLPTAAEFAR
jgi:hypothetical protein